MPTRTSAARRLLDHAAAGSAAGLSDRELLARFLAGEQAAFAAIVDRHGPMLRGCCRRWVGDAHLADDVLQATFVVLARKAASVRRGESLGGWLHAVARRIAGRARLAEGARLQRERRAARPARADRGSEWDELLHILDEELARLPAAERDPLVLCYLQGRTQDEAAAQLGLPLITLRRRLERSRERLRLRLTRRGATLGTALLAGAVAVESPALGDELRRAVLAAALQPERAGALAPTVVALADGLRPAIGARVVLWSAALLACGTLVGAGWLRGPARGLPADPPAARAQPAEVRRDRFNDPLPTGAIARLGTIALRHGDKVNRLYFAADGKSVYSGGGGMHRRWQVDTGHEVEHFDFREASRALRSDGLSDDGKTSAAIYENPERAGPFVVVVRDAATSIVRGEFTVPYSELTVVSPDASLLAVNVAGRNETEIWDIAAGERKFRTPRGNPRFSADGSTLVTCTHRKGIAVWDTATGQRLREFGGGIAELWNVLLTRNGKWLVTHEYSLGEPTPIGKPSPDGKSLASQQIIPDRFLRVWDVEKGEQTGKLDAGRCDDRVYSLAPDNRTLLVAARPGSDFRYSVQRWDVTTCKLLDTWPSGLRSCTAVALSPDGKTLATATDAGAIRLWDVAGRRELRAADGHEGKVRLTVFSRGGTSLLTLGDDRRLIDWDVATGTPVRRREEPDRGGGTYSYSPDRRLLAGSQVGPNARLLIWDFESAGPPRDLGPAPRFVAGLSFSPDGGHLMAVAAEETKRTLRSYDTRSGKQIAEFEVKTTDNNWLYPWLLPDGRILTAQLGKVAGFDGSTGRELFRWDLGDLKPEVAQNTNMIPSPDGRHLAVRGPQINGVELRETVTGRVVRRLLGDPVFFPLTFSPDGKRIAGAAGGATPRIIVWDVASGKQLREFSGHRGAVTSLAFSPDGKRLASGSADCTALVWEIR